MASPRRPEEPLWGTCLAGGNAVLVKPPEKCPLTLLEIGRIVADAGVPAEAHQLVTGGPELARFLAASPGVRMVSLPPATGLTASI